MSDKLVEVLHYFIFIRHLQITNQILFFQAKLPTAWLYYSSLFWCTASNAAYYFEPHDNTYHPWGLQSSATAYHSSSDSQHRWDAAENQRISAWWTWSTPGVADLLIFIFFKILSEKMWHTTVGENLNIYLHTTIVLISIWTKKYFFNWVRFLVMILCPVDPRHNVQTRITMELIYIALCHICVQCSKCFWHSLLPWWPRITFLSWPPRNNDNNVNSNNPSKHTDLNVTF